MRLWSLHPSYLDTKGLVALWREGLLAQNVLAGRTIGYKNHPQLNRFKDTANPEGAIASYLRSIIIEANYRGYNFNQTKIGRSKLHSQIPVTNGQLEYEFSHLLNKLKVRDSKRYIQLRKIKDVDVHPLFLKVSGSIECWEVVK